jgi:hypothetical protein
VSEGRWTPDVWERGDAAARRLPRIDDLPLAEQGFDPEAVRAAFDSFYRHAAELDATLRLLESVEVFGTQARELRAEIRSLRAASWGPLPQRHVWTTARGSSMPARAGGGLPSSLPRLAVEAAFIVLVAVGAALADLGVGLIVLLVLAAWLIVGMAEFAASTRRATPRPGLLPAPARREERPVAEQPPPGPAEPVGQATMIEPAPVAEAAARPEPEPERRSEAPIEPETEHPPAALQVEPKPGRRWFGRKRQPEPEPAPIAQSKHVRVLPYEPATEEPAAVADPWEQGPDLHPGEIEAAEVPASELELAKEPEPEEPSPSSPRASEESEPAADTAPAAETEPEREPEPSDLAPEPELAEEREPEEPSPSSPWAYAESEPAADTAPAAEAELEPEPEPSDLAPEPMPEDALAESEPGPPELETRRRFWYRRQREPEAEPTPEPIPEASPFESEPEAQEPLPESEPAQAEEQSPLPEVAPFQPEPEEEEERAEGAAAATEPAADPAEPVEARSHRIRLWSRLRREPTSVPEPRPPAPHVERIEVEQTIDPERATALWGEPAFAAEPKPGETWIQPLAVDGPEPEEAAAAQSEPATEEREPEKASGLRDAEAPQIAVFGRAHSHARVTLRRGRR